jgi:hypothetical protein
MTKQEYYTALKKERIFYAILILVWVVAIGIELVVGFYNGYWIWMIGGTIIYLYLKDVFTGVSLFSRLEKPKLAKPLYNNSSIENIPEHYPLITEREKMGYITLVNLCLAPKTQKEVTHFFEQLKNYSQDDDYLTTLNYVLEYLDDKNLFFIMSLDWKQDIETLEWRIKNSLIENFNVFIDLPNPTNYPTNATISYENVFLDYDNPLRVHDFQIGFIDTQSDEYVIFIHKVNDKERIKQAVHDIGYKYHEQYTNTTNSLSN